MIEPADGDGGGATGVTLSLRGVDAAPGGVEVLRDVDLELAAGSATTLIGPSGAGKTTLLRVIAGLTPTTGGVVLIDGQDVTGLPAHQRRIGVVFQEPRLFPHLSVGDNVAFGLETAGVERSTRRARAAQMLARVGLDGMAERVVTGLSGGEQQRVNLARALAIEPAVLLLDEPMAAVDPERRTELRALIAELTAGPTVLHVTHDRAEAAELGDRVAVLIDGTVVQHASPRDVFERPATLDVAGLVGADTVLRGEVRDGRLVLGDGSLPVSGPDGPGIITVRPEHVTLGGELHGVVRSATYQGTATRLVAALPDGQTVTADVPVEDAPRAGDTVALTLRSPWRLPTS